MVLETGRYTIVNANFGKVIGPHPDQPIFRPLLAIANVGTNSEPIFHIERLAERGPVGIPLYRIQLDGHQVMPYAGAIVVNAGVPLPHADIFILEHTVEDIYGAIPHRIGEDIHPLAWTLRENVVNENVSLVEVRQIRSIPPMHAFNAGQVFKFTRVG